MKLGEESRLRKVAGIVIVSADDVLGSWLSLKSNAMFDPRNDTSKSLHLAKNVFDVSLEYLMPGISDNGKFQYKEYCSLLHDVSDARDTLHITKFYKHINQVNK
jgi:hypothetical protein